MEWEIFFQSNLAKRYNIYLLSFHKEISNNYLAKMISRKKYILPSKFIRLLQIFNNSFLGNKIHEFNFHSLTHDTKNKLNNFEPSLKFNKDEISKGEKLLKKFQSRKIICIISRDGSYLSDKLNINDYKNPRNTNINDFIPALKALEKKDYVIFRMGKRVDRKLKYTSKNVIDYANSKLRSDFLDLYLIKKCNFFMSTGCGLDSVAIIFNKPILFINYTPIGQGSVFSDKFIYSYKKYYDLKKKKYLSLSKIFSQKLAYPYLNSKQIKKKGLVLKNIKKSEIKKIALEMVELLKKKNFKSYKLKKNQILFKKNYKKLASIYPPSTDYFGNLYPTVSRKFIDKNNFFLK